MTVNLIGIDQLSLVIINTATGLVLGGSSLLTMRVFPISPRYRLVLVFTIAAFWGGMIWALTHYYAPPEAYVMRRLFNAVALTYVFALIALYGRKLNREGQKPGFSSDRPAERAVVQLPSESGRRAGAKSRRTHYIPDRSWAARDTGQRSGDSSPQF